MRTVFREIDTMRAQEAAAPGSSMPWSAPFYYDDPDGGGVVEVVAKGENGKMRIAYAIESPKSPVHDVDFVPYTGTITIPKDWDAPDPTCAKLGSVESAAGKFAVKFEASSTVRGSALKAPLTGNVYGSIYNAKDVTVIGPNEGAEPVATIRLTNVDATAGPSQAYTIDQQLPSGLYQILGFMDIDANADPSHPAPDAGDPVFIPIGGYNLSCELQPVTAEFALTLPASLP
jgi:hypothetical protein